MFLESRTSTPLIGWSITVEKAGSVAKRGRKLWKVAFEEQFRMFQKGNFDSQEYSGFIQKKGKQVLPKGGVVINLI